MIAQERTSQEQRSPNTVDVTLISGERKNERKREKFNDLVMITKSTLEYF